MRLSGIAGHAAQPERDLSPTNAMCQVIQRLSNLPIGTVPANETAFVTVVGATLGEKVLGIAPGKAEVWATLRSETDYTMLKIVGYAEQLVNECASTNDLEVAIEYEDIFQATINSPFAVELVRSAAGANSLKVPDSPFRWSEDFGRFTAVSEGALFGIGAGTDVPELHKPGYDFPDSLIPLAAQLLERIVDRCIVKDCVDFF